MSATRPLDGFADPTRLYFLFDFISHNAYLAWAPLQQIAARHGLILEPVPVVFGAMLSAHGQIGPAEVPPKSRWMLRDVLRKARALGLPIAPPHSHPFRSLLPLRWSCCELPEAQRIALIDALWRATWAESREVSNPAVLRAIARDLGLDVPALEAQAESDEIKQRLRAQTDAALAAGAFGVPTMFARGELFWGYDDLKALDTFLDGRDPLNDTPDWAAWQAVRPTVERRR